MKPHPEQHPATSNQKYALQVLLPTIGLITSSIATAQPGGAFELARTTLDNGGGSSQNSEFHLQSTIAQADAGLSNGGEFQLHGGFWTRSQTDTLFEDQFEG